MLWLAYLACIVKHVSAVLSTAVFHFLLIYYQVTVVTSRPGQGIVYLLERGLKDADLVSLKRILVMQIYSAGDWGQDSPSPEATHTETEGRRDTK